MPTLFLHNTLSGKKEEFVPLEKGKVKMYSCGPTVYDFAHIGNFRSFLLSDLLVRVLKSLGYEVIKTQNITDVGHLVSDHDDGEDKILKKAKLEKKDPFAIARFFEEAFVEDEKRLNILPPAFRPRATDFIKQQIQWCEELIKKGYAYENNGSVYYRLLKFPRYGHLSKNNIEDLIAGIRVEKNPEKESLMDFALWRKADENHLMQWDSPWGKGFPGWHLECSVMSHTLIGFPFDIHTGGEDNIFPHHECEIAQNEAFFGEKSVNYWVHAKHLMVDGQKMSKSKGNFYTLRDILEKGYSGAEIRYLLLSAHYRTSLNFTFEGLEMARSSMARIQEARRIFKEVANSEQEAANSEKRVGNREQFQKALLDDLNVSDALSVVFEVIKQGMRLRDEGRLSSQEAASIVTFLEEDFNSVFDILEEEKLLNSKEAEEIEALIQERNQHRESKDWAEADRIRDGLLARGIELIDEGGKTSYRVV